MYWSPGEEKTAQGENKDCAPEVVILIPSHADDAKNSENEWMVGG